MDQQKVAKLWRDALLEAGQILVKDVITGIKPKMYQIETVIEIPEVLANAIWKVCKEMDVDSARIFETMATEGFNKSLQEKMKISTKEPAVQGAQQDIMKQLGSLGIDVSGIKGGMDQLKNVMTQITEMERTVEDVQQQFGIEPDTESSKDSKQSDLPTGKGPGD